MNTVNQPSSVLSREHTIHVLSGWFMLAANLILTIGAVALLIYQIVQAEQSGVDPSVLGLVGAILLAILGGILFGGFFTLQPNEARVLILFGKYQGTVRDSGFHWTNPFNRKVRISLRARNLNGEKLKVNDKRGNPIEIAAVVVWRVRDTAQALFDVDRYEEYVSVQSESAVRHLATSYAYDQGEDNEITLRSNVEDVSGHLQTELQERLNKAGVVVEEARLTHLAYAPEIASAMLRRQQAEAVIAARQKIVHGAVSMVEMALKELAEKAVIQLDEERKAAMVSNLLVVLCGESEVHPVVNTGTLYH
ncbi:MAG TPA: SPFH domain-containing protein [Candidatus Paceibacterota bacterium]|nr:SPFH domain-containing protein [Verrucomicrobiota bacterium]HOX01018.1 SPFH domain-containing protein [Verrucomicrobiota bacterium]HRZ43878.1 SPFH domain-containing protein [Candidatus Paceibacterota bacterium]HRZ93179.1 SPFH domain-containing protein [Candidatus Paceibacterota bacterium]